MASKYHVETKPAPPRFNPIPNRNALEDDGCLGCRVCVKRESCVYDVYKKREFDAGQVIDTADVMCVHCMRCVQGCKKNILGRIRNPRFERMGDDHWKPEIISSIWRQAETGAVPVSGAGYRGLFAGPGFDRMWTDMSEIVRPTRDGIHGREYISTVIELGRHAAQLEFDETGKMTTEMLPFAEILTPLVMNTVECGFVGDSMRQGMAKAAGELKTLAMMTLADVDAIPPDQRNNLIVRFDPACDDPEALKNIAVVEVPYADDVRETIERIKAINPDIVVSIRLPLDENVADRAVELAQDSAEILHLQAGQKGGGLGKRKGEFITGLVKDVHFELLDNCLRDQVTVLISGGIAMAEHVAKIIACGADGVVVDKALLVAMECRLCPDCDAKAACPVKIDDVPVEWAGQRIVNLLGSWHSQLIEVMGAMGIREVRRLRGELGRVMFFEDLERESFAPIFGARTRSLVESLSDCSKRSNGEKSGEITVEEGFPALKEKTALCPSRYRNRLSKYKVVRTSACIGCGKCAEVCAYGVHKKAGGRMLAPKSHLCRGAEHCRAHGAFCVDNCPADAIGVSPNPAWSAFGDPRWTSELLVSTWNQAETGLPPNDLEYKVGASGGGFDRIDFAFPEKAESADFGPQDVDLSMPLNRRVDDGRPGITIGVPFYGGGMSFGSISLNTMIARARAYEAVNSFMCTGEGGYPDQLREYDDHIITQIATGLFGVREDTIQRVRIIEFKYAQGAKPGLGGHLLSDKVTPAVAKMREAVQGTSLFSPFPFHSVYSVEDHKKHVDWMKHINPKTLVSVKVSAATDVDMVAVGSYYAGAHIIHIDGSYGGTGAAPDIAKKNIATPIEYAIPKVHRFLQEEGVRDEMTLIASGGLRTAWDVAKAIALGANGVVIGTSEVVALECIRCGVCESGRGCPRGIASTDPELSQLFDIDWATQRLINLFHSWAAQLQHILWRLGMKSVRELVGRSDVLMHLDYDNMPETANTVE